MEKHEGAIGARNSVRSQFDKDYLLLFEIFLILVKQTKEPSIARRDWIILSIPSRTVWIGPLCMYAGVLTTRISLSTQTSVG